MSPEPAAFGSWSSPLTAEQVADGEIRLSMPLPFESAVWWAEARPADGGRVAVVRRDASGTVADVLPPDFSARSRVHEYGGRAWLPLPGGGLVFANWTDQRLYRLDPGSADPVALTPEPPEPAGLRYADPVLAPEAGEVWWIREAHSPAGISRHLVAVPLDGSGTVREIVGGSRFLASPRPSPDGRRVAWLAWEHPQMPWDGTELRIGEMGPDGTVASFETVLGSSTESVLQPEWADVETLWVISDRSGWWNCTGSPPPVALPNRCARARRSSVLRSGCWAPRPTRRCATDGSRSCTAPNHRRRHPRPRHRRARRPSGAVYRVGTLDQGRRHRCLRRRVESGDPDQRPAGGSGHRDGGGARRGDRGSAGPGSASRAAVDHGVRARRPGRARARLPAAFARRRRAGRRAAPVPRVRARRADRPVAAAAEPRDRLLHQPRDRGRRGELRRLDRVRAGVPGPAARQWGVVDVEDCVAVAQALVADGSADPARLAIRGGPPAAGRRLPRSPGRTCSPPAPPTTEWPT